MDNFSLCGSVFSMTCLLTAVKLHISAVPIAHLGQTEEQNVKLQYNTRVWHGHHLLSNYY